MNNEFILATYGDKGVITLESTDSRTITLTEAAYLRDELLKGRQSTSFDGKEYSLVAVLRRRLA